MSKTGPDSDPDLDHAGRGCRPRCSGPHGSYSIATALLGTIAVAFAVSAGVSCHFFRAKFTSCSTPPEPKLAFSCCGDCYCIPDSGEQCPTEVPNMDISKATIEMFKSMQPTNPYNLTCNPYDTFYTGVPCETTPPQILTELGDAAVCGVLYNRSSLDQNQCPTQYSLQTYPDEASAKAAGAVNGHFGSCGVCSTTQDLAVYIESPDLTTLGVECSIAGLLDVEEGIRCYERAGYTRPCSTMWISNGFQTKDYCGKVCLEFRLDARPNNGPPPQCTIDECLQCDENFSGPLFQKVAARSRRRSGLISRIARSCDAILFVDHENPCDVVNDIPTEFKKKDVCKEIDPNFDTSPPCFDYDGDIGLIGYAGRNGAGLFQDEAYGTKYGTCFRFETSGAVDGFWKEFSENTLGPAWKAATTFSVMTCVIGAVCVLVAWMSTCFAYRPVVWTLMTFLIALCGVFSSLTLVFFASDVCENGCTWQSGASFAVVSSVFFFVTAFCCRKVQPFTAEDMSGGSCPVQVKEESAGLMESPQDIVEEQTENDAVGA